MIAKTLAIESTVTSRRYRAQPPDFNFLSSIHALRESFKFAEAEKCWMTVVSVIPPYLGDLDTTGVGNVMASMRKPCEDALAEAASLAGEAKIMVRTSCEEGETHERIVDLSDSENYDLIVMGRRGQQRLERALVGSVTARVIGYSHKDVLSVGIILVLILGLFAMSAGVVFAEEATVALAKAESTTPWWVWPLTLFVVTFVLGIVAVLGAVGGGVLFVPIIGGFFPFHIDFVRGAGCPSSASL